MRLLVSAAAALALAFPLTESASAATTTVEVGADYVFESTEEADTLMETFATRCKKVSAQYTRTNGAFNDLYKIGQRWGFCWSTVTHKVTSLYGWERWKQCCDPGWSWVSWEPTTTYCWTGCKTVTRRIEGHTKFCIPLVGCPDHDYPWVKLFLYGTGGWNATKGSG
jgi:hypothetical protein